MPSNTREPLQKLRIARCPRCGNSTRLDAANTWRPFCSERCKLIDLGDWFSERHAIPGERLPDDESSGSGWEQDQ